jgi:CheY-like chemotaxis protein
VEDTGIGIPEEKKSLLFERFSQIDSSYAKPFQGTGLGLAISKKLVELMGGDIWLSNSSDAGSTFCFTVQLGQEKGLIQQMNAIRNVIECIPEPGNTRVRILVVEDDDISRQAIVTFLKKQDYDILIAENGIQAIEIAKNNPVDIILMDIQMPELDGFSATREIRTNLKLSNVPIIAMTAYALSGDREKCLRAGMDDYVSKPINFEEIKTKIMKHVN